MKEQQNSVVQTDQEKKLKEVFDLGYFELSGIKGGD